ncbi:MAG: ArnT family glycosyltransferase [Myxococcales bacterium]
MITAQENGGVDGGQRLKHPIERALWALTAATVSCLYFFRLGQIPPGLFLDETSVGYNARAIGRTLADQYGNSLPLFFRALEDYKSPLYVYASALTEAIFGPTAFAVRLPSALYAIGMAVGLYVLVRRLTAREALARWMAALSLLAPSIFTFGRHAVSETSSFPFWLVLALNALLWLEREPSWRSGVLAGAALGLCTYTYTTGRLLAPLMVAAAALCFYLEPRYRRAVPALLGGGALLGLPMALFMLRHPHTLDKRFHTLWILKDNPPWTVAASRMAEHYAQHLFSIDFLFRTGDHNLRHNIGVGLLPVWLALPLALGVWSLWQRRSSATARFLLALLALSPIPVSLCHDAWPHASRMLHFVPLAYVVAAIAIEDWLAAANPARALVALGLGLALVEGGTFLHDYFVDYPPAAQPNFDGGAGEALRIAFAARRGDEPLYAPDGFFVFDGTYFQFWGDLDPVRFRQVGLEGMGIHRAGRGGQYPPGSLVILPGGMRPFSQPAELVGTAERSGGGVAFSVWRTG